MTENTTAVQPVRVDTIVDVPIERAFELFVTRFDDVKPKEHNLMPVPIAETVFEPRVGGNIYDRADDGTECRWSRVLAYEPPNRLLFSWDINGQWQIETDPAKTSEVEVVFTAESDGRTRVRLEHRNFDRHGDGAAAVRTGVESDGGWPLYLRQYRDTVNG